MKHAGAQSNDVEQQQQTNAFPKPKSAEHLQTDWQQTYEAEQYAVCEERALGQIREDESLV